MDWALLVTIVCAAVGGTWAVRSGLSELTTEFRVYAAKNESEHRALEARVIPLEKARRKR